MQRRTFLKMTGAGASIFAGGTLLSACGGGEGESAMTGSVSTASSAGAATNATTGTPLGVQIYTLRDQLREDVRKTLADIAAVGYKKVELFGLGNEMSPEAPFFGMSAQEFGNALAAEGLSAPISHIDGDAMNIAQIADAMQELGGEYIVVAAAPGLFEFDEDGNRVLELTSREKVDEIAERLIRQGEMAQTSGIGFGYHNHQFEFAELDDGNAFDYLYSRMDPELVKIELDIGWTMVAGHDPVDVLTRYAGRVISVHVKDYDPGRDAGDSPYGVANQIVEPGSGPTDFGPIIAALDETGVMHRFVEIDLAPDPVAAITKGYNYLTGL